MMGKRHGSPISPLIQIIEKIFGLDVDHLTVIWHTINLVSCSLLAPPHPLCLSLPLCCPRSVT